MTNIVKAGPFSDGGYRVRVVADGYNADPAPSDTTKIIFDSDWPEVMTSGPGFFGSVAFTSSDATIDVSFGSSLPYAPIVLLAFTTSTWYTSEQASSALWGDISDGYVAFANNPFLAAQGNINTPQVAGTAVASTTSGFTWTNTDGVSGTLLWMALLNDPTIVGATSASRIGAGTWMEWSPSGIVVTKPGKSMSSTDWLDYLIPPVSSGYVLAQPVIAGSISELPWVTNRTTGGATYGDYYVTIPHNLGFVPFFFATGFSNLSSPPSYNYNPTLSADTENLYIFAGGPSGSSGSTMSLEPTSYFVLPRRWV